MKKTLHYYSFKSSIGSGIKRFLFSLGLQSKDWVFSRTKNESDITFFSFITSFIFIVLMTLGLSHNVEAQNSYTWNGGGADNNMTTGANWGGSAPGSPQVFLNFAGSNRLTPNNNFSAISGGFQIFFKSGAGSFIVGGNLITFYNYGSPAPLIQNEGTALQTINFPISNGNTANNGDMNINGNGSGGPITFGSTFTTPNGTNNRTLKINNGNGSGTVTFNGAIGQGTGGGKLAFAKNGANSSAILGAANTYTGNTDINAGTLFINGSTSSSSPVTVLSGATLAGNGTAAGSVTLSGIVSPGATSATTANLNTGAFTFNANSSYRFEMNNATGTAGNASGWDKITSTGAITCSASPITLNLVSLSVSNFNPANAYTWPIASASSISGFNASNFTINTASFASFTGIFSVTLTGGNTINLVYLPPSSGPAQPSAISGPTTVCNGTSQTYSVTNDINATSYQWTLPSGWSGTSSTNSITVTVANPSGSLSVVAQNAGGDSFPRSVFVNVGVSTSITTQPSTSAQSVCLGGSVTALSVVAAGSSLTYQWYSNTSQTNSGGTLITGATSSSYTPTAFGTPLYYYCTVGGSCAPTSVSSNASGLISISGLPNDTATYTISNGGNGGQGFGPWAYSVTGGSGGTFTEGNGSNVQIGQAWGLYANGNGITSASRAFVAPMAIGNNVSFAFDNGDVNAANSVGVRLRNASNGILMEFRFLAGASEYSIYDGTGVANTGVTFTTTGLSNVSFAYTGVNTYAISITKAGVTTTINGRTFATVSGGQVPAAIEFFNSNAGIGATKNIYFNALTMGYPKIFVQPVISVQNVCQNGTATTLSVVASGSNLGYQWYSNPGAVLLGGQTASTFSPPTDSPSTKTYYCVVSYTGSCGTVSSITSASSGVVTVFGLPTATISGTATVCQNAPASITFTGANGTPPYEFQYTVYEVGSIYPPGLETVTTTSGSSVTVSVPSSALGGMLYELIGVSSNVGSSPTCTGPASGSVTVTVNAGTIYYTDADGDTYGDLASPVESCDGSTPSGTVSDATDCDDNDPSAHEKFSFYVDADGDTLGFGSLVEVCAADAFSPPLGYSLDNTDCDDTDSRKTITYPFYADADGDTYGTGSLVQACAINDTTPPSNFSLNDTDCDDTNALKFTTFSFYIDADEDTFGSNLTGFACAIDDLSPPTGYSLNDTDCDDTNALKTITYLYYVDADVDTYGSLTSELLCTENATSPPLGYAVNNTDCDDADPLKFNLFSFYEDLDGDSYGSGTPTSVCGESSVTPPTGYSLDGTDCDDSDDSIYRSNPLYVDVDGDGYDNGSVSGPLCYGSLPTGTSLSSLGSDCDDTDNAIFRSALLYVDVDGDGHTLAGQTPTCYGATLPSGTSLTSLGIDCDDADPLAYQTATLYVDVDGDTYVAGLSSISCYGASLPAGTTLVDNGSDCDDNDATKHLSFNFHYDLDGDGFGSGLATNVCAVDQSTPPTGYSNDNSDCDDNDNLVYRSATLYTDLDGDTYTVGAGAVVCYGANLPAGTSLTASQSEDCDDADPSIFRIADLYTDLDGDGHDDGVIVGICIGSVVGAGTSLTTLGSDCDDNNALVYRSATLYTDLDGDNYTIGAGNVVCYGANLPAGTATSSLGEDCDDTNVAIFQSAILYTDLDGDGFTVGEASSVCYGATIPAGKSLTTSGNDCDDANPAVNQTSELYADADNDGFGAVTATAVCAPVSCTSNTIAVNFRVDMTGQTVTSGGVHIAGNFATRGSTTITSDWAPDAANSQLHAIGNNIYELTVLFPATSSGLQLEFKFLRGNTWFDGNQLSEQSITNDCGASGNRLVTLPATFLSFNTAYEQCPTSLQKFLCSNSDCDDNDATKNATFSFFVDADGDGFGTGSSVSVCAVNATSPPVGYTLNDTDCDDNNNLIYRTADLYVDVDGDGYTVGTSSVVCYGASLPNGTSLSSLGEDCDDSNNTIYQTSDLYVDVDGDGYTVGASSLVCYGASLPNGTSLTSSGEDCDDTNVSLQQSFPFYVDADQDSYGAGAEVMVCTLTPNSAPIGYSSNNTDCDDTNIDIYQFATYYVDADGDGFDNGTASVCSGVVTPVGYTIDSLGTDCDDTNPLLTDNCSTGSVVNLTLFVQGYYTGGSTMTSVKLNQDYESPDTDVEDLTVELHDALDYSLVDTAVGTLKTDGTLSVTFNSAAAGSYYIAVKGSNIVQTWSAAPQAVGTTPLNYDFSTSASQAYGDNMSEVEPGVFAFYQGDIAVDDLVDLTDFLIWETKYLDFAFGVEPTDLNGDGLVDLTDFLIWETNYLNFVFAAYPF